MAVLLGAVLGVLVASVQNVDADEGSYLSPLALVADHRGEKLYVAEFTARQVAIFDVASRKVSNVVSLADQPSGIAIAPNGKRLYVTGASRRGRVRVIDLKRRKARVVRSIPVGHMPGAPAISPDGKILYVCNRFDNNVSVVNLSSNKQVAKIPVLREPVASAITPNGKTLFVANLLPAGAADRDYAASSVSVIDTAKRKVTAIIQLPNGSTSLRGICVSPDGKYAYVTHILARYQLPTTQLDRGWMNTNALSIIDVVNRKLLNTVLLDDVDLGAANPWGVACTADGKYVCVTHAGTHELSIIERAGLHDKLERIAAGQKVSEVSLSPDDVPNDLSFLVGLRRRLKLTGKGPRGLAIIGTRAYAAEYFTDSLGILEIEPEVRPRAQSLTLGPNKTLSAARKGEMLFNNAEMCFQQWQSCASCHPDARADALNWDLLNDGMGNPKNTKSMLLAHKTPPAMITGIRDGAEVAVRAGIRHIQFAVRPEDDAVAIDEYLKSLDPVPSPFLVKGWWGKSKLSKSAKRGKKVFKKAGCASCHSGSLSTDLQQYKVGTGRGREKDQTFDTPTLVEVWRTAPYLYDGRAATIKDVLTEYNKHDKHGKTSALTGKQINDLAEYILSR
jgi:YVTN family beta-propeller protein